MSLLPQCPLRDRLVRKFMHFCWRFSRPATLGVRAAVFDAQGRVFLIKHSYVTGWHMPGGGVETGETVMTALKRELAEEGNIELHGEPVLHGIFFNARVSRRDHVLLYVVRAFRQPSPPVPGYEIIAHGFFAPDALPEGTSRPTRERLAEILEGRPRSEIW